MNGHCSTCTVEKDCGYEYKPTDCCNHRKFKHKAQTFRLQVEFTGYKDVEVQAVDREEAEQKALDQWDAAPPNTSDLDTRSWKFSFLQED